MVTCLSKEALPLIRYRTRDITRLMYEPCPCGRTTARMEKSVRQNRRYAQDSRRQCIPQPDRGGTDQHGGIGPNYEIVVERKNHTDILTIRVEVEAESMMTPTPPWRTWRRD